MNELYSSELDTNKAWQATVEGRYSEAIMLWNSILSCEKRFGILINAGITNLLAGELNDASRRFEEARNLPPQNTVVEFLGVVAWLAGRYEDACQNWADEIERRRSGKIVYSDAAGGVQTAALLWWASACTDSIQWRKIAEDELKHRWRNKQAQNNWPGKVAPFLLGKIPEEELISATSSKYPSVEARRLGQAYFYIAAHHLHQGNRVAYQLWLANSISLLDTISNAEHYLARYEMQAGKFLSDSI